MLAVGHILDDKYELIRLIGEGGMGSVFEARHLHIGKRLAVKVLNGDLAQDSSAAKRFTREAEAAATISHPGVIDIHDLGLTKGGSPYLVMEYLEGQSLAQRLSRGGPLDPQFVAYIGCQILSALGAAHTAGVVHRDLKPDNIFLVDRLQQVPDVKILDFGISMFIGTGKDDYRLTQTGQVLGTPYYMSPEQMRGKTDLDHRTDLFSLGVILYESLTDQLPFDGENLFAIAHAIQTATPDPLSSARSQIPEELEAVVFKAMAKELEDRWCSAEETLEALLPFVDEHSKTMLTVGRMGSNEPSMVTSRDTLEAGEATTLEAQTPPMIEKAQGAPFSNTNLTASDLEAPSPSTSRRRNTLLGLGLGAAVVLGGLLTGFMLVEPPREGDHHGVMHQSSDPDSGWVVAQTKGPEMDADAPPRQATKGGAAEPSEQIEPVTKNTLTLQGLPEGAFVTLDGVSVAGNELRRPASDEEHTLQIELDGHEPWIRSVTFRESKTIEVELQRRRRARAPRSADHPRTTPPTEATTPPTQTPPPAQPQPERERPLDRFGSEFE